jgi:hypothetical protein
MAAKFVGEGVLGGHVLFLLAADDRGGDGLITKI